MTVIELENIGKQYRLGTVGSGTLRGDIDRWWHKMRGKEDPNMIIGQENKLDTIDGEYVWALRDVNLKVEQGEVLGIIGKNGAGKSTMLKLLSRVTTPTTGQIKVRGRIASLLEVGTGFHGELTGRENIFINGAILGMTKQEIKSKFDEIVDFAGVAKYIDTPVKRYSSGMYVRLAFAVAAHLEPEILIVDEVLAVGDAEFQKKAIGKMQDISKGQGRTVLFVSHNMASVQKLCTRGVLMENGGIVKTGDTEQIIFEYIAKDGVDVIGLNDKGGNKKIMIIDYYTLDKFNNKSTSFLVGELISLVIKIKFLENLDNFDIGINFRNSNDELITHLTNLDNHLNISGKKDEVHELTIQIPQILTAPDVYKIDIGIVKENERIHILENCFTVEILKSKLIGRPGIFPSHVKMFTPSIWSEKKIL